MKKLICLLLVLCILLQPQVSYASSNEKIIYRYLTETMNLKTSAACGILANIRRECDFNHILTNRTGHFGLCQWGGVRKQRLIRYCKKRGYDYRSLKGQLNYLRFELKNYYPKVYKRLKTVNNNSYGAYQAGYYFCYYYEIPGSRKTSSISRGNLAKKYFSKYAY